MEKIIVILTYLLCYLPLFIFSVMTPYLTRKTESFGVGIPEEMYYEAEVKRIRDNYRNQMLLTGGIISLVALGLLLLPILPETQVMTGSIILQLIVMFLLYLKGHQRMKELKVQKNWILKKVQAVVVETSFHQGKLLVSLWWFVLYLAVIAVTIFIGFKNYNHMPDQVPMHFNLKGQVDHWEPKSFNLLFYAPLTQLFLTLLFGFIYWIIKKAKQQINAGNPEQSLAQNKLFRYRWSAFIVFMGLLMMLLFGFIQLIIVGLVKNTMLMLAVPLMVIGLIVVAAFILSISTGQGGSQIRLGHTKSGEVINRDDDRFWKLGQFYYNPDDPALFVEKRFGIGWTSNFARPLTWVILLAFILLVVVFSSITSFLRK